MMFRMARRMLTETDPRLLWKFSWNAGFHGLRAVQRFKKRLKQGITFPPFLYVSIINSCNLRCQGCWVKVDGPSQAISRAQMHKLITEAKVHGNRFFGILGGEPFLHPELLAIFADHPDCYFQVFTNGQLVTDEIAAELRRLGNVTPLISIEGSAAVSDTRRGRPGVLDRTLRGLEACTKNRLITGVATSVCQTNIADLLTEAWLEKLIALGVHYCWFYTYRPVGAAPNPELCLTPEQILQVRRFIVTMRARHPIGIVDAYWDDQGRALCPMAVGISHHINPWGQIEPCPIIQFAKETIHDGNIYDTLTRSAFLKDFRELAARHTRGCVLLERPDLVKEVVARHAAADSTHRPPGAGLAELDAMIARTSQHQPGQEIPEEHWAYRFAKKHWFFGFGAYG